MRSSTFQFNWTLKPKKEFNVPTWGFLLQTLVIMIQLLAYFSLFTLQNGRMCVSIGMSICHVRNSLTFSKEIVLASTRIGKSARIKAEENKVWSQKHSSHIYLASCVLLNWHIPYFQETLLTYDLPNAWLSY
jgi:hypothetical protein